VMDSESVTVEPLPPGKVQVEQPLARLTRINFSGDHLRAKIAP
jgi:hypothetical protein